MSIGKKIWLIVSDVMVIAGMFILGSWLGWNEGYKEGKASAVPVVIPSLATVTVPAPVPPQQPPATAPAPAPAPVPVPTPAPTIVNPPAVNVIVNQTVNGIETSAPTPVLPLTPPPTVKPATGVVTGNFKAKVYDAGGWYIGSFKELSIDHLWGSAGPINRTDNFRVIWEGTFSAGTTSDYRFKVVADGGVQLFVDDYLIIDKKSLASQSVVEHEGGINLAAGPHEIVLKYYETTGDATVRLLYGKN